MDKTIFDEMIATRRHLHTIPEEGWTEFETTYLVAQRLKELGYTDIRLGTQIINPENVLGRNEKTRKTYVAKVPGKGIQQAILREKGDALLLRAYSAELCQF